MLFRHLHALRHICAHILRANTVNFYAVIGMFNGNTISKSDSRMFSDCITCTTNLAQQACGRGGNNEAAAFTLNPARHKTARGINAAHDVNLPAKLPLLIRSPCDMRPVSVTNPCV